MRHGETGLLVEPGSAEAIGKAVTLLLADEKLRLELGQAAARWVMASINNKDLADKWLNIYRHCR